MLSIIREKYFPSDTEASEEDVFGGQTFSAHTTFVPNQFTLAYKVPASGWTSPEREWNDLFRERVAEPRRLMSLWYSDAVEWTTLEIMKTASLTWLKANARTYGISVGEAFKNANNEYPGISVDPEVMAGAPCIVETRIPVYMVLDALEYHGTIEGVLKSYPRLTRDNVKDAIGFSKHVVECPIGDET